MKLTKNILEAINIGIYNGLNEAIMNNHRGRPTTSSKLFNLYPIIERTGKEEEKAIRAWVKALVSKANKIFYLDNLLDVNELRRIFILAIYKFMEKNKSEEFDWECGNARYSKIYNIDDIDSFLTDLRTNYYELCKNPNFPKNAILLSHPVEKRRGRPRKELSAELQALVAEYISEFGLGTPYNELDDDVKEQLSKYTLAKDGFVYVVCRPIRNDSDSNAPAIVYKLTSKYNVELSNAIRLTYTYQCAEKYLCYVNYMYVSSIHLDKYMRDPSKLYGN